MKISGLTAAEVAQKIRAGQTNAAPVKTSRSLKNILRANILTPFNALLAILAVVVVLVDHSFTNALFGVIMVINSGIGIWQELKAKRILDKLAILHAPHATVMRDFSEKIIPVDEVVLGDVLKLKIGDQIVADGEIVESSGLEIDESLLTGESEPIAKNRGDKVLSGSFVTAGAGFAQVKAVGAAAYQYQIAARAKRFQRVKSELLHSTNLLLKWISWLLVVVAPLLIWGQLRIDSGSWRAAVIHSVAAIVGMIPEGLVLLTSAAFMLASVQLARRKVLVQQMPAVEGLARVDTLLLDKTGTLTDGKIKFEKLDEVRGDKNQIERVLKTLATRAGGATNAALLAKFGKIRPLDFTDEIPFSSARKWSGIEVLSTEKPDQTKTKKVQKRAAWILGAPEILFADKPNDEFFQKAQRVAAGGWRVLALCRSNEKLDAKTLPRDLTPQALVVLGESVRPDAAKTLKYFKDQGVDIKIISGDSPLTVAAVARAAGLDAGEPLDARELADNSTADGRLNFALQAERFRGEILLNHKKYRAKFLRKADARNLTDRQQAIGKTSQKSLLAQNDNLPTAQNYDAKFLLSQIQTHNIFGRVQPEQKRLIVRTLQKSGRTVAMTGDGVNDALALKDADIGIAMNSGAPATKAVAEIVLLDNKFSHLPNVLAEGRRVIANIERVANLFVIKNVYSLVLSLCVTVAGMAYPYQPIQMTVISFLTIGAPAFCLALAPNDRIYRPGFLKRVLSFAVPVGITTAAAMMLGYGLASHFGVAAVPAGTATSLILVLIGLGVLILLARPLKGWKLGLILTCGAAYAAVLLLPFLAKIFEFQLDLATVPPSLLIGAAALGVVILIRRGLNRRLD
ncbi:MAG: HAD-IC family P-type ATPase [Candidatus Nomurabacteria bacterium]|jgi:cation-transporting ATPase E|nr:HAD-IC family P-type ATPase [Candidatus Nomurabacteria bacterium]